MTEKSATSRTLVGTPAEVFVAFFKLGLTSFGGPIAHLGYFHNELVVRRRWLTAAAYADLVALCQFLPGPASSQTGFALGLLRAGWWGALAAWLGFTLPSALVLVLFAWGASALSGPLADGVLHGLKIVAVAVVAQAVWGMARTLAPDRSRAAIAVGALAVVTFMTGAVGQVVAIVLGGLVGLWLCRDAPVPQVGQLAVPVSRRAGALLLSLFAALLVLLPLLRAAPLGPALALADSFYRSGALVFGGGHVVLPLLEAEVVVPGGVSADAFLAGYGMAQAVPGPLFTFGAYLGALLPPAGVAGAATALIAIFLPGLLLVAGMLPFWDALRTYPLAQAALRGTNAAVVGLLGAALYDPLWTSTVRTPLDFVLALVGFVALTTFKIPPWQVVLLLATAGGAAVFLP